MSKKLLSALLLSSAVFGTSANAFSLYGWEGNFLLGAMGGWATTDGDLKTDLTGYSASIPAGGAPVSVSHHIRSHNDNGGIFGGIAGVQLICNRFLMGLEVNVDYQDIGDTHTFAFTDALSAAALAPVGIGHNGQAEYERGTVVGLTGRVGYQLTEWLMPYLRAGAETSEDRLRYTAFAPAAPYSVTVEDERRSVRFVGGGGFEFPLFYYSTLRLEYNYSSAGKGASAEAFNNVVTREFSSNVKPSQHAVKAAWVWNFK